MKIIAKLTLLSAVSFAAATAAIIVFGIGTIERIAVRDGEKLFTLELLKAKRAFHQALNRSGMRSAIAAVEVKNDEILEKYSGSVEFFILDTERGEVVYSDGFAREDLDDAAFSRIAELGESLNFSMFSIAGSMKYLLTTDVPSFDWIIGVSVDRSAFAGRRDEFFVSIGVAFVVMLLATAGMFNFFGRTIVARLKTTTQCIEEVEKGNLSARIRDIAGSDEISHLQHGVNAMSARISERSDELEFANSELRDRDAKLTQAQKMEAVGQLTGGVAHDFNNLLAVILGNLELLDDETTDPKRKELIENSIDAAMKGSELTKNMLSFARQAPLRPTTIDLNKVIEGASSWIARTIPASIEVEMELAGDLMAIRADSSSVESALLNLIVNARDAMPGGGRIRIETSNALGSEVFPDGSGDGEATRPYVKMSVTDTGVGIPDAEIPRIFEPFYSTKSDGDGSGMGLSMLEGFVDQSGGVVRVDSELSVGSAFVLYFPAIADGKDHAAPRLVSGEADEGRKGARILCAEDNEKVLEITRAALSSAGYEVIAANSGDLAFELSKSMPEIDLLLTDIVMPGRLQGTDLAVALREDHPELPVVFLSGYANEAETAGGRLTGNVARLLKPVRKAVLLSVVSDCLAGHAARDADAGVRASA